MELSPLILLLLAALPFTANATPATMPQLVELLGQRISIEAVFLMGLSAAAFGVIIRELIILIFWRAILIWVGCFMFLCGFSLAAFWIPSRFLANIKARRKPVCSTIRFYAFAATREKWSKELSALEKDIMKPVSVYPESTMVSTAIDQLLSNIQRDFILSWFAEISPNMTFPFQVDAAIRQALIHIVVKMKQVEWAELLVTKLLPIITDHFRNFVVAESAVRERSMGRDLTDENELQFAVASQYCQGRLHPAISLKHYKFPGFRKRWLRTYTDKLVPELLGPSASSAVVTRLSRDILSCSVLFPVLSMFSEPDFWNQMLVTTAGPTVQDRRKVEKLIQALNEHAAPPGTGGGSMSHRKSHLALKTKNGTLKLTPSADLGDHEKFLQEISKCKSLPEARQTRYYISVQLQRSKRDGSNAMYISRLQQSKRAIEKRINKLSGKKSKSSLNGSAPSSHTASSVSLPDPREEYSLQQILKDPACTLFFMEFMDRRDRIMLVQFWLTVNSLRDPLAMEIDEDDDFDENTKSEKGGGGGGVNAALLKYDTNNMIQENDIIQIHKTYFQGNMPYVSFEAEDAVARFVKSPTRPATLFRKARRAILQTQSVVYKAMVLRDLVKFKRSDLFLKFLASDRKQSFHAATTAAGKRPSVKSDVDSLQLDTIEDTEPPSSPDAPRAQVVKAVEAAFNNIMDNSAVLPVSPNKENRSTGSQFGSEGEKKRKRRLFEPSDSEGSNNDEPEEGIDEPGELHLAAPGDLSLTEAISTLSSDIDMLYRQEMVLAPLIHKAELTGNSSNLRILRKSKASLEREIQCKELQCQQYIVQERDNSLYGRSRLQIRSYMNSYDAGGARYMSYIIEVERLATDGSVSAGWVVSRRYSQFLQLHQHLRNKHPEVRKLAFPKKGGVVMKFQQKAFVDARKVALQNYLRELLNMPAVCRSKGFRAFLSSETFSMDLVAKGKHGGGGSGSASDEASISQQEGGGAASAAEETASMSQSLISDLDAAAELDSTRPFIQPICDMFIQVFGLARRARSSPNWLRGRAVVVVVQQLLGGTIEKRIRDAVSSLASEHNLTHLVQKVTASIWPEGVLKSAAAAAAAAPRTAGEKVKCKHDARVIVHALIRDASIKIVGSSSSRYAGTQVFEMFQNEVLNAHLVYSLLDALLDEIFQQASIQ